jgi:hypothetical protein
MEDRRLHRRRGACWSASVAGPSRIDPKEGDMTTSARIELEGRSYELPIIEGTEHEKAIDISKLRSDTGYITLDDGYGNTGSCA